MSRDFDPTPAIDDLLDGCISPDDHAALDDWLTASPDNAHLLTHRARLHRNLHTAHGRVASAAPPKPADTKKTTGDRAQEAALLSAAGVPMYRKGYEPQPFKLRAHHYGLAAAALLIAGLAVGLYSAVVYYQHQVELEKEQAAIAAARDAQPVATLIQRTGNLTTPSGYPSDGRDYGRGEYALSSGSAEFMLTNSVNVKLSGSTRLHMHNNMNVALTRGSAEFVCPKDAKGFTVHLPDRSKVADLGTAFEVIIDHAGKARLRVTDGAVEWTPAGIDAPPILVRAGQSARMVAGRPRISPAWVIYEDGFDGTGNLHGAAPDSRPGSETWIASQESTAWQADGSIAASIDTTDRAAFLPFTPEPGNVYTLSLDVDPHGASTQWFALGFTNGADTRGNFFSAPNGPVPWMLERANGTETFTFIGPGNSNRAGQPSTQGTKNLRIVLDTRQKQWSVAFYRDTALMRSETFVTNPTIHHVAFGRFDTVGGVVDNFSLTIDTEELTSQPTLNSDHKDQRPNQMSGRTAHEKLENPLSPPE